MFYKFFFGDFQFILKTETKYRAIFLFFIENLFKNVFLLRIVTNKKHKKTNYQHLKQKNNHLISKGIGCFYSFVKKLNCL